MDAHRLLRFLAFGGMTLTASSVSAGVNTWTTNGPEGGSVRELAIDPVHPATLYAAAASGGLFKSTDGGGSWRAINSSNVLDLAIDPSTPSTLYAGTDGGVLKSTDGGESWTGIAAGLMSFVRTLAIDPSAPATLYAGTGGGVFKSEDSGESWAATNTGLTSLSVSALAIDPSAPATLYAATFTRVFKSADGGVSWTHIHDSASESFIQDLVVSSANSATLFFAALGPFPNPNDGGVYKSIDGGVSWTRTLGPRAAFAVAIDPSTSTTIYAGTRRGVSKSTNGGTVWDDIQTELVAYALAIDPSTPATLYAGTPGGVLKSGNAGGTWTAVNGGLIRSFVSSLAIDPSAPATIYAGTGGGGVSRSNDGGESWTAINVGLDSPSVTALAIDPSSPATVYAGTLDGVFKSSDRGLRWNAVNTGLTSTYVNSLVIDSSAPATLYAAMAPDGVFKTTDGGESWTAASAGLTGTVTGPLAIDPSAPATLYVGTHSGGIFKSSDGGESWTAINAGLTNTDSVSALAINPSAPATLYAGTRGGGVFKSDDGGKSWTPSGLSSWGISALAIDPSAPARLSAGTENYGVFESSDGGETWTDINAGLTNSHVQVLALDPVTRSRLYAGTGGGGVFARDQVASSPCSPTATRLCLVGNRYAIDLVATHGARSGRGAARPLSDRAGSFGLPFATGDSELPEVVVKMLPDGAFGVGGAPVFYSSLTTLPFALTVTDTLSGKQEVYARNSDAPFCGSADIPFGALEGSISPRSASAAAGETELRLLGGRFSVTLEARHPRSGRTASGVAMSSADRFGFFSLPDLTGDPQFPEVVVKMVDARSFTGKFWFFHTGLTSLDYTLTVTDSVTGAVRIYESETSAFCGAADTKRLHGFASGPHPDQSQWRVDGRGFRSRRTATATCRSREEVQVTLSHVGETCHRTRLGPSVWGTCELTGHALGHPADLRSLAHVWDKLPREAQPPRRGSASRRTVIRGDTATTTRWESTCRGRAKGGPGTLGPQIS